jgi:hypothetical protein
MLNKLFFYYTAVRRIKELLRVPLGYNNIKKDDDDEKKKKKSFCNRTTKKHTRKTAKSVVCREQKR